MKVPLLKANFIGSRDDLNKVIQALKTTGAFQITKYKKTERHDEAIDRDKYDKLMTLQKRLKSACAFAHINTEDNDTETKEQNEQGTMAIVKKFEQLQHELHHIENTIKYNEDTIRGLKEYINLPVQFSMLESTKSINIICGIMPIKKFGQFVRDFSHLKLNIQSFPSGKTNKCVVITSHNDDKSIADVIHSYDFIPCRFAYDKTATGKIESLKHQNEQLLTKRILVFKQAHLPNDEALMLKNYYDHISNEIDTMDLVAGTLQTQKYYVLNGWVIQSEIENIRSLLTSISPHLNIKFEEPNQDDDVPVLLKNSKFVTPFRSVTNMYGVPGSRDIDPNPFVAVFYFLFFGMMIGDIGYALVLCTAVFAFIYFKKPKKNVRQFLMLFGICSISAAMWGLFFGSIFGFRIGTMVIDPLEGAIYVLLLSLMLGLVQMSVGVILDVYSKYKNGNYYQAALKGLPRVILFFGLILFLPAPGFQLFNLTVPAFFNTINAAGMWITIIGAAGTALSNPYSLVSYFNDVISYVRLFALALVGTVIATIGNQIGGMLFDTIPVLGHMLGIIIAVAFHTFNLGLGLLGAYIHGARLQFIEFFSKFYTGDGREFRPIGKRR